MTRAWFSLVKTDNELKDINPVLLEILENNLVFSEKAVMSLTDKDINSFRVTAEDFEKFFRPSKPNLKIFTRSANGGNFLLPALMIKDVKRIRDRFISLGERHEEPDIVDTRNHHLLYDNDNLRVEIYNLKVEVFNLKSEVAKLKNGHN